ASGSRVHVSHTLKGHFTACAYGGGTVGVGIEFLPDPDDDPTPATAPWESIFYFHLEAGVETDIYPEGDIDDLHPWYQQVPNDVDQDFEVYVRLINPIGALIDSNVLAEDEYEFTACDDTGATCL